MNVIVSSSQPAIYLDKGKSIYSYDGHTGRVTGINIMTLTKRLNSLDPVVVKILTKMLPKLRELGISFRIHNISVERDVEIPKWRYAVIEIGLEWRGNPAVFEKICDYLVDYSYASLTPEESMKVLVLFNSV